MKQSDLIFGVVGIVLIIVLVAIGYQIVSVSFGPVKVQLEAPSADLVRQQQNNGTDELCVPSGLLRIGVINNVNRGLVNYRDILQAIEQRMSNLGYSPQEISLGLTLTDLQKYDVIYLPTGWAEKYSEYQPYAETFREYTKYGGGLFIEQPNPEKPLSTNLLPYPITFINEYDLADWPGIIAKKNHSITAGLSSNEMPGPADQVEDVDSRYAILVKGRSTGRPSLLVTTYEQGRILILLDLATSNPKYRMSPAFSDEVYCRMIEWVAGNR